MEKRSLAFAEQREAGFIYGRRANSPGMADVDLLDALVGQITETRQVGPAGLKPGERLFQKVIGQVVVSGQALVLRQFVIDFYRELIAALVPQRYSLEEAVSDIRCRDILRKQIRGRGIETVRRNSLVRKNR